MQLAGAGCGVAHPEQVRDRTGLDMMQAMLRGEIPFAPIARTLDFMLVEVGPGCATFQGTPHTERTTTRWAPSMAAGSPRCWTRRWAVLCTP
jgi:hypothetical protein